MSPEQALAFLDVLRSNYYRVAREVDLQLMPSARRDQVIKANPPAKPFYEATWFGRIGTIVSVWSLWDCYSRLLCEGLPVPNPGTKGSCVDKVGRSLAANSIAF